MTRDPADTTINAQAAEAYQQLRAQRQETLVAPEDDMWATFADLAEPHSLTLGTQLIGCFSVDDDNQLHGFHVSEDFEDLEAELLRRVIEEMGISAAMASTVDPRFLSLALTAGTAAHPVALMYHQVGGPQGGDTIDVRLATSTDWSAAVAFYQAETGSPEGFLEPYLAERIDLHELYLVEVDGKVEATGECRVDNRSPGNAHLGLVVASDRRSQGTGSRLMHTLTKICEEQDLAARCSTEPTNTAARRVIHRAGFRNRHHAFQIAMSAGETATAATAAEAADHA